MSETYRKHIPPHERSLPEQTLDALLRIEELLTKQLEGLRVIAQRLAKTEAPEEARGSRRKG